MKDKYYYRRLDGLAVTKVFDVVDRWIDDDYNGARRQNIILRAPVVSILATRCHCSHTQNTF